MTTNLAGGMDTDTGDECFTGVIDPGNASFLVSLQPVMHASPVSLAPARQ
jgi:hypothetical protein